MTSSTSSDSLIGKAMADEPSIGPMDGLFAALSLSFLLAGAVVQIAGASWNPTIPHDLQWGPGKQGQLHAPALWLLHILAAFRYRAILLLLLVAHVLLTATRIAHPDTGVATYREFAQWSHGFSGIAIVFLCLRLGGYLGQRPKEPAADPR